jgi:hypothetical protein
VVTSDILRREWSRDVTPLKNDKDGDGFDNDDDDDDNDNSS